MALSSSGSTCAESLFWSEITRPVANVTLRVTPALITRQRQNLGRTRSRGIELEANAPINTRWSLSGGYALTDARVREFPANATLEGLWLPQIPRHQLTFQTRYDNPSFASLSLQGRALGAQFDDDQNRFQLESFFVLDGLASRRLAKGVELFAAAENIFNRRYSIGRTPIRTIGPPALFRLGLRVQLGSK
ncbi:MAG: TonB-dependent receptor [Pyrinomonadaceae bacterium]